jgi:hypothetical protein
MSERSGKPMYDREGGSFDPDYDKVPDNCNACSFFLGGMEVDHSHCTCIRACLAGKHTRSLEGNEYACIYFAKSNHKEGI